MDLSEEENKKMLEKMEEKNGLHELNDLVIETD